MRLACGIPGGKAERTGVSEPRTIRAAPGTLPRPSSVTLPGVQIRPARGDDVAQLVRCYDWLFAPPGSKPPVWDAGAAAARLHDLIGSDRSDALIAEVDGVIAGYLTIYLDILSVRFGQRAWIEDMAVAPERRSCGIGMALLDVAKSWARERGASHLELDSALERAHAHRFYEREGAVRGAFSFHWPL